MSLISHQSIGVISLATILFFVELSSQQVSHSLAQVNTSITPTSGVGDLGTRVTANGRTVQITGGTRPNNGTNLFHSFDQFSVGNLDTAKFINTTPSPQTSNILARITGNNPSSIFGTIDTTSYPSANLFLMNPAGIIFGPNAALNVSGSIAFTTADYLRLADANGSNIGIFHADPTMASLFTSAPIAAFGFLGPNPAPISIDGSNIKSQFGRSLTLAGGNITVEPSKPVLSSDTLKAPSIQAGQVYIASLASPGEILVGTLSSNTNVIGRSPGPLGTIQLSKSSTIDTSESGGGTIHIRGGQLVVNGTNVFAKTGNILIDGTTISLNDSTWIVTFVDANPGAKAGDIIIAASQGISMDSKAKVESQASASLNDAGNITLRTSQGDITLSNEATIITGAFTGGRNTGSIEVDAQNGDVRLENASLIFPSTDQDAGKMGSVLITSNNLYLFDKSVIDSDNRSTQAAGNVNVQLRGLLRLTGKSSIETIATGKAPAANLDIKAREVRIEDGSRLSADTTSSSSGSAGTIRVSGPQDSMDSAPSVLIDGPGSGIFTDTKGIGPGGIIDLSTKSLTLQNGGIISSSTMGIDTRATGGSITITATDQVLLNNHASITASSDAEIKTPNSGIANAGNIKINAGQQLEGLDNSSITTQAAKASGGNIDIRAIDRIRFVNSTVSTSVLAEDGKGGNIFIDPNVVILEGSEVTAKAVGGAGGNITFVTPLFLADSASLSLLSAKSESGLNGTVLIQSPTSNLSGAVGQLVSKTSPPQVLLQNRCVALAGGEQSTFILAGRDALPSQPGGWLSSPVAMEHWTGDNIEEHASGLMVRRVEPRISSPEMSQVQGTEVLSLRRLTPSGFLVRSFADRALTGCRS